MTASRIRREPNAYILDWTMNDYATLRSSLSRDGFDCSKDGSSEHIRVRVELTSLERFTGLVRAHLNESFNYVDVQFESERLTVVIFRDRVFRIRDAEEDRKAKDWAISAGLPREQADWKTSF